MNYVVNYFDVHLEKNYAFSVNFFLKSLVLKLTNVKQKQLTNLIIIILPLKWHANMFSFKL